MVKVGKKPSISTPTLQPVPDWLINAMQGLCYWIGHHQAYYRFYPLFEGAISGELCKLIGSKVSGNGFLQCEGYYQDYMDDRTRSRMDLFVADSSHSGALSQQDDPRRCAIEVKRGSAGKREIDQDIARLLELKRADPSIQTYLLIVSETSLPKQYDWFATKSEGGIDLKANPSKFTICNANNEAIGYFKVRRVCKAMSSLSPKQVHSAVLVEVLTK